MTWDQARWWRYLSRHRRRASPVPQVQGSRGGIWTDVRQVSIGRDRLERTEYRAAEQDDAGDALRSSTEHAAFEEMVLAQGLGHADRQAPRDEKGDRGPGTPAGRDHAPDMGYGTDFR